MNLRHFMESPCCLVVRSRTFSKNVPRVLPACVFASTLLLLFVNTKYSYLIFILVGFYSESETRLRFVRFATRVAWRFRGKSEERRKLLREFWSLFALLYAKRAGIAFRESLAVLTFVFFVIHFSVLLVAKIDWTAAESILVRSLSLGCNWKLPRLFWMLDLSHSSNLNRTSPSRFSKLKKK